MSNHILSFAEEYLTAFRLAIARGECTVHVGGGSFTYESFDQLREAEETLAKAYRARRETVLDAPEPIIYGSISAPLRLAVSSGNFIDGNIDGSNGTGNWSALNEFPSEDAEPQPRWSANEICAVTLAIFFFVFVSLAVATWYVQNAGASWISSVLALGCACCAWMAWRDL